MTAQVECCEFDVTDSEFLRCYSIVRTFILYCHYNCSYSDVKSAGESQLCRSVFTAHVSYRP